MLWWWGECSTYRVLVQTCTVHHLFDWCWEPISLIALACISLHCVYTSCTMWLEILAGRYFGRLLKIYHLAEVTSAVEPVLAIMIFIAKWLIERAGYLSEPWARGKGWLCLPRLLLVHIVSSWLWIAFLALTDKPTLLFWCTKLWRSDVLVWSFQLWLHAND